MYTHTIPRHKVFISYYHKEDQEYKNYLISLLEYNPITKRKQSIFDDYSIREKDVDDTGLSNESVRKIIRDDYIQDASVLILLCGQHTKERKFIDWELHAAMSEIKGSQKLGIIVINLPTIKNKRSVCFSQINEKGVVGDKNGEWIKPSSRKDIESLFPYMPSRIIDNLSAGIGNNRIVPITVVNWETIKNDNKTLKLLIDNAFKRSRETKQHYDISSPLKGRNK